MPHRLAPVRPGLAPVGVLVAFVALGWFARAEPAARTRTEFVFHHDHVVGTSLDLCVVAPDEATAENAEAVALAEVERLRMVFSTYDPASEISRVNGTHEPTAVCAEMAEVLHAYERWGAKSGGAFNGQVGELVRVWKEAEKANAEPAAATLERIAGDLAKPGWKLDAANTLTRLTDQPLNLNAIAKGYIIRAASDAVRRKCPEVSGLLVNLGGDILAWGTPPEGGGWAVGIQDPFRPFDNAPPIAGLKLMDQAVATSGGYQRFYTVGGKRYSHVFDPRTGRPAEGVASATVVAPDNLTANALATTLCVLPPAEGLKLVAGVPGAECLVIGSDGKQFRSAGLKLFEVAPARVFTPTTTTLKRDDAWPADHQVTVAVELPQVKAGRYRKPYVAVWVEDDKGKAVRTLAVWGNAPKYLKDLNDWWKIGKGDAALIRAVTRATRGPGKYSLTWDGKDEKGNPVPQGTYTVRVEVHREFGAHLRQSGKIECKDKDASVKMDKNAETGETVVEFKKVEKKDPEKK
jgi:thiamine biosynthesis lipoprotein ApbE